MACKATHVRTTKECCCRLTLWQAVRTNLGNAKYAVIREPCGHHSACLSHTRYFFKSQEAPQLSHVGKHPEHVVSVLRTCRVGPDRLRSRAETLRRTDRARTDRAFRWAVALRGLRTGKRDRRCGGPKVRANGNPCQHKSLPA